MPKKPDLSDAEQQMRLDLGVGIRQLRENVGASPAELAAVAGVSLAHQYRIEAGERTADMLYFYKLIKRYGMSAVTTVLGIDASQLHAAEAPEAAVSQHNTGKGAVQISNVRGHVAIGKRR